MAVKGVPCLIALTILAAGCLSGGPGDSTPGDDQSPARKSGHRDPAGASGPSFGGFSFIDLVDCEHYLLTFLVPQATVEDAVPPQYEPTGFAPDSAQLNLFLLSCKHVSISNQTIARDVTMATLVVRIQPPEGLEDGIDIHYYRVEAFVSDATVAAAFNTHAASAAIGSVSWSRDEATYNAAVEADGSAVYDVTARYGMENAPSESTIKREHYEGPNGSYAWIDLDQTARLSAWPGPALVNAESGPLSQALTQHTPAVPGLSHQGTYSATLTFHERG